MKVNVITRHAVTNYGSLLQALAMQRSIEKLGCECEIIDYVREDESYWRQERTLLKGKPEWNKDPIKKLLYLLLRQPESILAGRRLEKERHRFLKQTELFSEKRQLENNCPLADIYMTGSDQVWGPTGDGSYDSSYCLSFVSNKAKKVAYAASFGHTDMTKELCDYYRKWLSTYQSIAVREDSAVDFLHSINIDAQQVIDPTLLLTKEEWSKYIGQKIKGKYVLIYQLHNDPKLGEYAEKVAKAKSLPLIRVSVSLHQINRPGKLIWCPSVGEFLSYIQNADCLVTDSFHGTAFAINLNTPFVEVLPKNNTGIRNISILKMTGLSNRILKEGNIDLAMLPIDFTRVNKVLEEKRKESIGVLKDMLQ